MTAEPAFPADGPYEPAHLVPDPGPAELPVAVVTGASSGIGAATARRLVGEGFRVVAAARRVDRLEKLAEEIGVLPVRLDVTDDDSVAELAETVPQCAVLINNAGGALGLDPIAKADLSLWQRMFDVNVLGSARVTKALLPAMLAYGRGHVVNITSIAGHEVYEGGGGYSAAKFAQHAVNNALRLELNGLPVRVTEIAPGMVKTDEFGLVRFGGDEEKAMAPYRGVAAPLTAEDIADCITFAVTRPAHLDIDLMIIRPVAQATSFKVHRTA
ncbi:MAG TPA: SDR family NAD(P)-dependent oxidoreductase [Actinocrinis sp.]|jgi:NADP-dependent 3-hydroxy acid dehydrogenase YdfG